MELTREEAIRYHREMWNWIADQIEKRQKVQNIHFLKEEYITNKFDRFENIRWFCFLCEYTNLNCKKCPIEWGNKYVAYESHDCPCETWGYEEMDYRNGLYGDCRIEYDNKYLRMENNWKHQAELARRIANLPERKVEGEV